MNQICEFDKCTGCGMCSNICPNDAIEMTEGAHGFVFPKIDHSRCVDCFLCKNKCPSNSIPQYGNNVKCVYAAWNKDKGIRKQSTSGGIFDVLAKAIINNHGIVCGVSWSEEFHPQHIIVDKIEDVEKLQGSKYSQSNTEKIYRQVKEKLDEGTALLFSGTPCQSAALKRYLGKDYDNLFIVDLVCHGVPSNKMFDDYLRLYNKKIARISLRYKDPYWDYCYVKIDFKDGTKYQNLTVDDDYFNLFNIGYSLRESCHNCQYTNTNRIGDVTLADFWGYRAHSFATRDFNKGVSCILINSLKGEMLFKSVCSSLIFEKSSLEKAIDGNKSLKEPFKIDKAKLDEFWTDYDGGMNVHELNEKYCARTFCVPKHIAIERLKNKYRWLVR